MNAVSQEVLAVQQLSLPTEMAVSAKLRVISRHLITNLKPLHVLSNLDNNSACLMAGHNRHRRIEVTVVDVKVGTADATGFN